MNLKLQCRAARLLQLAVVALAAARGAAKCADNAEWSALAPYKTCAWVRFARRSRAPPGFSPSHLSAFL
jgi:hypothetical protein